MGENLKEMPEETRPYEKFMTEGANVLSDAELLAILLRSGTQGMNSVSLAGRILKEAGGTLAGLRSLSYSSLLKIPGIGKVKAIQIMSMLELSGRIAKSESAALKEYSNPDVVAARYRTEMRFLDQEVLKVLYLNNRCGLIREKTMSIGTVNSAVIPVREILVEAIRVDAVRMILIHNHPCGDPTPSREDIEATRAVAEAGKIAGISLEDHIIIGGLQYVSLRGQGILK